MVKLTRLRFANIRRREKKTFIIFCFFVFTRLGPNLHKIFSKDGKLNNPTWITVWNWMEFFFARNAARSKNKTWEMWQQSLKCSVTGMTWFWALATKKETEMSAKSRELFTHSTAQIWKEKPTKNRYHKQKKRKKGATKISSNCDIVELYLTQSTVNLTTPSSGLRWLPSATWRPPHTRPSSLLSLKKSQSFSKRNIWGKKWNIFCLLFCFHPSPKPREI